MKLVIRKVSEWRLSTPVSPIGHCHEHEPSTSRDATRTAAYLSASSVEIVCEPAQENERLRGVHARLRPHGAIS
jgi:hypothetical protein